MQLLDLDDAILRRICLFLPGVSVARLQGCCRRLKRATRKNALWKELTMRDYAWWATEAVLYRTDAIHWQAEYNSLVRLYDRRREAQVKTRFHIDRCNHSGEAPESRGPAQFGEQRPTCERCWRPLNACLCSHLPDKPFNNCHCRVIIVQHPRCHVADGTIRLLVLGLKHCEVLVSADVTSPRARVRPECQRLSALLDDAGKTKYLLYPKQDAVDVAHLPPLCPSSGDGGVAAMVEKLGAMHARETAAAPGEGGKQCECGHALGHDFVTLIAIDGSWRHAKHIVRMNPRLMTRTTSCVSVNGHPPSIYGAIKREPTAQCLCTAEAVSFATSMLQCGDSTTVPRHIVPALRRLIEIQVAFREDNLKAQREDRDKREEKSRAPARFLP